MTDAVLKPHRLDAALGPDANGRAAPLLLVSQLSACFQAGRLEAPVLHEISFEVGEGETVALVGESGSGKSVTALSIMRLLRNVRYGGAITFGGCDLLSLSPGAMGALRGRSIAMIFQDPMMSLHPTMTVGSQIGDVLRRHKGLSGKALRAEALRHLEMVRIANASARYDAYPHELSGGMCQRVMIASALASTPQLLIADEPTTALDVTVQAEILDLLRDLKAQTGMATLFVTHDMGVVAELADRVVVMRDGRVVEDGAARRILTAPTASYTTELLASVPRLGSMQGTDGPMHFPVGGAEQSNDRERLASASTSGKPILRVRDLSVRFGMRSGFLGRTTHNIHAVRNVSFDIHQGETLALVGESGSGKSTTGRAILKLVEAVGGEIWLDGVEISQLSGRELRRARQAGQMVFQDPVASLNPQKRIRDSISEPLRAWGRREGSDARVDELLQRVGLDPSMGDRLPHEFSGGQRQRICIARALALEPKLIIADEAVSALDVSVKALVCNLFIDLQREFGLACLFISHDMAVVERLCDRVAVMRFGEIVEIGPRRDIFETPAHPYTRALLAAVPNPDPDAVRSRNEVVLPAGSAVRLAGVSLPKRGYRQLSECHLVLDDGSDAQFHQN